MRFLGINKDSMDNQQHITLIAKELNLPEKGVKNTFQLFQDGATIPFIARYRKELTGSLDEVQIAAIQRQMKKLEEIEDRKITILNAIEEQQKLTPELRSKIMLTWDANELEDIYLPYKRRKKTRADIAREYGLEPLAKIIMSQKGSNIDEQARRFLNKEITSIEEAIQGARDIIAEWVSEDQHIREILRNNFRKYAKIVSRVVPKMKENAGNYQDYFEFEESLSRCPSHRYLAMMRGKKEGILKITLVIDDEKARTMMERKFIRSHGHEARLIAEAIADSYDRLIFPSVETQIFNDFREKADDAAIDVFSKNLRQLLLSPPLGQKAVVAVDPGFRTGCKVVCLSVNGDFLEYKTIFPNEPQRLIQEAEHILIEMVHKYSIEAIAIGNGTASRETRAFIEKIHFPIKPEIYIVNESGASIYSASEVARDEFPNLDLTVRGAISIGRRLMDPLAELVKIDAKSIGVGQYQHDVHQGKLKESLDMTVMSCVNKVGVNLNTASQHILTYIAGIGPTLAKNIVAYRRDNGEFKQISQLKSVPRLGEKAFEQASGFLRIRDAENPLDNTGVHPESYSLVSKMAKTIRLDLSEFIRNKDKRSTIRPEDFVTDSVGLPTIQDIMLELDKPGLDPRGEVRPFSFDERIRSIDDVYTDMVVPGIVTNLTNFGAFVDIGAKQDALLHISQITDTFIQSPADVLKLGQELMAKVLSVDISRKRINLTLLF